MDLFSSKKDKNNEIEDTIKILSTNLEVLNQKLSSNSSGSFEGLPQLERKLDDLSKKVDYVNYFLKGLQNNLGDFFSSSDAKFNILDKEIKKSQTETNNHIDLKQNELKKDINQGLINLLYNINEKFKNNNLNLINLFNNFDHFKQEFPQRFSIIDEKLNKLDSTLNQNLKTLNLNQTKSSSQTNLSPAIINDLKVIRNELEGKFQEFTNELYPLIKINKELIEILRKEEKN